MSIYIGKYCPKTKEAVEVPWTYPVLVHPGRLNRYADLSPYVIKNKQGELVENAYQFRKIYPRVSAQNQWNYVKGYQGKQQTWSHPEETHLEDGQPTPEYWNWRPLAFQFAIPMATMVATLVKL